MVFLDNLLGILDRRGMAKERVMAKERAKEKERVMVKERAKERAKVVGELDKHQKHK